MAKIDKVKEAIGYLKLVFGILIAIDASLLAWLFQTYLNLEAINLTVVLAFLMIILVTAGATITNRKILLKIDQLEEL